MRTVSIERDFAAWRNAARELLRQGVEPRDVLWNDAGSSDTLFAARE